MGCNLPTLPSRGLISRHKGQSIKGARTLHLCLHMDKKPRLP
ncbi:rCG61070 [Rattus norvegicus]|uniref:RCG61070 n=1 Tax=Rattus norvegicus TaxID=10116 RepID=A6JJN9_RAT|nr:rCG61070 [Rattus norvegicus]